MGEKRKKKDKNRHKVSFVDKIDHDRELVSTVFVLSQKKYNAMNTFDGPFETEPEQDETACCILFWSPEMLALEYLALK